MKHLYLITCCFLSLAAAAQVILNRATHNRSEWVRPVLVNINNELYFFTENQDSQNPTFGFTNLYKYGSSGTQVFRKPAGNGRPAAGLKSLDNKLVVAAEHHYCDVVTDSSFKFLNKYDQSGNIVFSTAYGTLYMDDPRALVQAADSSYLSFTDSLLFRHDKNGVFMFRKNLGVKAITCALMRQNGNVLVSGYQGNQAVLAEFSVAGVLLSSVPVSMPITNLATYGNQQVMAGSANWLFKFSPSLVPIGSAALTAFPMTKFIVRSDTIYAIAGINGGLEAYGIVDSSFVAVHTASASTSHYFQRAIALVNDKVAIVSVSQSKASLSLPVEHYAPSLSILNKNGSNTMNHDLKLSAIGTDSAYYAPYFSVPNVFHVYHRATALVKNVGTTPVSRFTLNCYMYPSVACGGYFYQEEYTDIGILQPGDSISVKTSTFIQRMVGPVSQPNVSQTYCYFVTLPNGETDKTFEDNEVCHVNTMLITGLSDDIIPDSTFEVFPNPAESTIAITASTRLREIVIKNQLGMVIYQAGAEAEHSTVDVSNWSHGVYFVTCFSDTGAVTKKVVKY